MLFIGTVLISSEYYHQEWWHCTQQANELGQSKWLGDGDTAGAVGKWPLLQHSIKRVGVQPFAIHAYVSMRPTTLNHFEHLVAFLLVFCVRPVEYSHHQS